MVALGPRVGGAHVDVNFQMSEGSLDTVGKRIHSQLARIGAKNRKMYQRIGSQAVAVWRAALGSIVASAPLIGSAVSALAGGVTMIAGAFAAATKSASSLVTVLGSVGVAAGTAVIGFQGFGAALSAADPEKLAAALKNLSPSARDSALAVRSLSDEAHELRLSVQQAMFKGLSDDIRELSSTLLPVASAGLTKMGTSLNGLAKDMLDYVNSSAGLKQISGALDGSVSIFDNLRGAAVPFLDGALRLFNALVPSGERLADTITRIAEKFQSWTQAAGFADRIDAGMQKAEKTAGLLFSVLGNLGGAISNIFGAANPATNRFLTMLKDVTQRFQDWTGSVGGSKQIEDWANSAVDVMGQFGETAGAAFELIAELADPRLITSFLVTLENAFTQLSALPLDSIVSGFASMAEALEPISGTIVAVIIAGAAFNVLLGNLVGQIGGVVSAMVGIRGSGAGISSMFSKISYSGKHGSKQLGKFGAVFKNLAGFLAKGLKFAGFAGMVIWIGTIIAKSDSLKAKVVDVFGAMKGVFDDLMGAFAEIGTALSPVISGLQPVFDIMDKLMGLAIGVFLDMVKYGFESVGNVIKGAGSIIAGIITVLRGLFTLDFSTMWEGIKQIGSGIGPLLKGAFGLFVTFFAPARLLKIGAAAIKGLGGGLKGAMPGILAAVGGFLKGILRFFLKLPGRLLSLGGRALSGLWNAVKIGTPKVLAAAGQIVTGILRWIGRLPGRLLALGTRALSSLWNAVKVGTPKVLAAAGQIVTGVLQWIGRLPGRLLTLGGRAITFLWNAFKAGVGKLLSVARSILTGIVNALKSLPGKLRSLASRAISFLWSAFKAGVGKLTSAAKSIFRGITNALKSLPSKLMSLGRSAISRLASAVRSGISRLSSIARSIFNGIISALRALPGRLMSMGRSAISRLASAVRSGISRLSSIARSIFNGIISALRALPGRLMSMGRQAISRLASAVQGGISRLRSIATRISSAVVSALKGLPGKLLQAGKDAIGKLASGILGGLGKVKDAGAKVAGALGKFFPGSPIKEGPLKSWNQGGAGKRLMGGLAGGVLDSIPDVDRAGNQVAAAMNAAMSPLSGRGTISATVGTTGAGSGGRSLSGGSGPTNLTVNMNVSVDDLDKMTKVGDFLEMLDNSRANSRRTLRSGSVGV